MKRSILFVLIYMIIIFTALTAAKSGYTPASALFSGPLNCIIFLSGTAAVLSFSFGIITSDYSWVDRLWSILPAVFAWVYFAYSRGNSTLLLLAAAISVWALRLSFNFARKGGYTGTEDYRWPALREKIRHPFLWQLFHLLFINVFQISLFVLFTLPLYIVFLSGIQNISILLLVLTALMAAALIYEFAADQQQWDFHLAKHGGKRNRFSGMIKHGFLQDGLFRYSRHPNYFGELSFWWLVYAAGSAVTGSVFNPGLIGIVLLTLLFIGSTGFTESISASKYSGYSAYQRRTSAIIPFFPRTKL